MNFRPLVRKLANWAALGALVGQLGCASMLGERYYEGGHYVGPGAPEAVAHAPHSSFHPVPTRPVFSPRPTVTLASSPSATSSADASAEESKAQTQAVLAMMSGQRPVKSAAVSTTAAPTPASPEPGAGTSSRRVAAAEEAADVQVVQARAEEPARSTAADAPAPAAKAATAWTDRFGGDGGWRPRVR